MPTKPCTAQRRHDEVVRARAARRPAPPVATSTARRPVTESGLRSRAADAVVSQWIHELSSSGNRVHVS